MTRRFGFGLCAGWLVLLALSPQGARAQEGPATTGGSDVVDAREAELDAMQREAEAQGQPSQTVAVVEAPPARELPPEETMSHRNQVGLRVGLGVPYIFAVKYGEGPRCDDTAEEFCHHFGAALLDLELGFGVSDTVELSVLARIGLADDVAADASPIAFGIGARAYTSPSAMFKAFLGGRFMLDVTSRSEARDALDAQDWSSVDVGARGELGLQFDVIRYVGLYAQIGASIMLLRGLGVSFDGTAGAQARFP